METIFFNLLVSWLSCFAHSISCIPCPQRRVNMLFRRKTIIFSSFEIMVSSQGLYLIKGQLLSFLFHKYLLIIISFSILVLAWGCRLSSKGSIPWTDFQVESRPSSKPLPESSLLSNRLLPAQSHRMNQGWILYPSPTNSKIREKKQYLFSNVNIQSKHSNSFLNSLLFLFNLSENVFSSSKLIFQNRKKSCKKGLIFLA